MSTRLDSLNGSPTQKPARFLVLAYCMVDLAHQKADWGNGTVFSLTSREVELLDYLSSRPSKVVSREDLYRCVWGYHSSTLSRAVDTAIKRLREKIEMNPTEPQHIFTVHGVGYRFEPSNGPLESLPVERTPVRPVGNLWGDLLIPVGREREATDIVRLFESGERLITLMGPPGIGKTTLARYVGQALTTRGTGDYGVWFCDLSEAQARDDIITLITSMLESARASNHLEYNAQRLDKLLARQATTLLILDNFEHLTAHAAATVGQWLTRFPSLRFLVTSREQLPLDTGLNYDVAPLPDQEAAALFIERARIQRREFSPTAHQTRTIHQIIEQLDGIPLAIELAASRIGILPPEQILERLKKRFDLLRRARSGHTHRHDSMRGAIDGSWEMLTPWERDAFVQLAVFRGGFSLAAAEAVLDVSHHAEAPPLLDIIQLLFTRSLIHSRSSASDPAEPILDPAAIRFNLYDSIREYAVEKLLVAPYRHATEVRHAQFYLGQAEALASMSTGNTRDTTLERLTADQSNFDVMFRTFRAFDAELLARAALSLHAISIYRDTRPSRLARLEDALSHSGHIDTRLRIRVLFEWCSAAMVVGGWSQASIEKAQAALTTAVGWARDIQDQELEARALHHLGRSFIHGSHLIDGLPYLEHALLLARQRGLLKLEIVTLLNLGTIHERTQPHTGESLASEALSLAEKAGFEFLEAVVAGFLMESKVDYEQFEEAEALGRRTLPISERHNMLEVQLLTTTFFARMHVLKGEMPAAEILYRKVIRQIEAPGNPVMAGIGYCEWASVLHLMGNRTEALAAHEQGMHHIGQWSSPGLGQYYGILSAIEADLGHFSEAEAALEQARVRLGQALNQRSQCYLSCCGHFLTLTRALSLGLLESPRAAKTLIDSAQACLSEAEALRADQPLAPGEGPIFVSMYHTRYAMQLLRQVLATAKCHPIHPAANAEE